MTLSFPNGGNLVDLTDLHKSLASYLLTLPEGGQILSIRELSDQFKASMGSVSAALNDLEALGAITLSRRGRLGSFLERKTFGILWRILENGPMIIALTLPSFPKSEGLATAIYSLLDRAGIETYMTFIRGSFNRIKTLRNGRCHAIVISSLAAEELCDPEEEIILRLPPQSFVTDHRVFYKKDNRLEDKPMRIGIDLDSFDIKYLTELEFTDHNVEFIPMPFVQTDRHLEQSPVDAAISNLDHLERLKSTEITSRPLSQRVQNLIGDRDTAAAVVIKKSAITTKTILQAVLKPEEILEIQQKVVDGWMVPRY